jgi:hypothetical protein
MPDDPAFKNLNVFVAFNRKVDKKFAAEIERLSYNACCEYVLSLDILH